jgi:hypothetical protein
MQYGPQIVKNGLVLGLDTADRNSILPNSLINMNNWTVSNGSVTGYNQNGDTAENQRSAAANPWGDTGIIWGTFQLAETNDDGGWNTTDFNIDNTKLYRFSVWVKRTSSTSGGTFYFGMNANGDGPRQMDNNAVNGNPYWSCIGPSGLVQNVWHLYVGHVYPSSTSYTGRHPDTGYYFINNPTKQGDVNGCNIGSGDLKWSSNSTTGIHRTYHFYCADSTTRLQFYNPRVDLVDGKQPSITELVTRSPIQWKDLSGNGYLSTLTNGPVFDNSNKGNIVFDGSNDFSTYTPTPTNLQGNPNLTVIGFYKRTASFSSKGFWGIGGSNAGGTGQGICNWNSGNTNEITIDTWSESTFTTGQTYPLNTWVGVAWRKIAGPMTRANCIISIFNGTSMTNYTSTALTVLRAESSINPVINSIGGITLGSISVDTGYCSPVNIANHCIYNRILTDAEVSQNFQATKTRFGL